MASRKYEYKMTNRQARKKRANAGHERGKAKAMVDTTLKNEALVQRRAREAFNEDLKAGLTTGRQRDGSWWRHTPISS